MKFRKGDGHFACPSLPCHDATQHYNKADISVKCVY